jgi:hypothetical protein
MLIFGRTPSPSAARNLSRIKLTSKTIFGLFIISVIRALTQFAASFSLSLSATTAASWERRQSSPFS